MSSPSPPEYCTAGVKNLGRRLPTGQRPPPAPEVVDEQRVLGQPVPLGERGVQPCCQLRQRVPGLEVRAVPVARSG